MHTQNGAEYTVVRLSEFENWLRTLSGKTRAIVLARLDAIAAGHLGNQKRFEGLLELRWRNGNRVYAFFLSERTIVILNGGNKNGQDRDIKKAKRLKNAFLEGARSVHQPRTERP